MIDTETMLIEDCPTYVDGARFLKTLYINNRKRFINNFIVTERVNMQMHNIPNFKEIIDFYEDLWDKVEPFSYEEAFKIKNESFRAKVFSSINIPEMIENLGSTRVEVSGINLNNKIYNETLEEFEIINLEQVYELHKVNCSKLGIDVDVFVIKCWCTSTNNEHWIWTNNKSKDPLDHIASTCMIYESMVGNIKHIIRQGDVFLFEMKDDNFILDESEKAIPMSSSDYFKLLKSQS